MRFVLPLVALGLGACERGCEPSVDTSLTIEVLDDLGNAIDDAVLTYTVDGGPSEDCDGGSSGFYYCGWEESGALEVTASWQEQTQSQSFEVRMGRCHVIDQSATFIFEAAM